MIFADEMKKAAEAMAGFAVVSDPRAHPYIQALAEDLRKLAESPVEFSAVTVNPGPLIVGPTDPGGTEPLRVDGDIRTTRLLTTASALTPITAGLLTLGTALLPWAHLAISDGVVAPAANAASAQIYVDSVDGDLKVKFGDGVVKTLATDV